MKLTAFALLLLAPALSFAAPLKYKGFRNNMPPLCTSGSIPAAYTGNYFVAMGNSQDKIFFNVQKNSVLISLGGDSKTYSLKSCVIQGVRVATLTDPQDPRDVFNLVAFVSLDSKQIMVSDLREAPVQGRLTIQDIILKSSQESINAVMQAVK